MILKEESLELCYRSNSIQQFSSGKITGILYWKIGDIKFPSDNWNDFIVIVLGWWAHTAANWSLGERKSFCFMDGSYELHCEALPESLVKFGFKEDDQQQEEYFITSIDHLKREIDKTIHLVVRDCKELGFKNSDLSNLNEYLCENGDSSASN